jgi:hypothetical protein
MKVVWSHAIPCERPVLDSAGGDVTEIPESEFEKSAAEQSTEGLLSDFWFFLRNNKKWWLVPILVVLLLFGLLMLLSGSAAAPFIYTLF